MRVIDGNMCYSANERGKILKDYIERIMNEENE